jgi:uncharacterized protein YbjT (DUF2867 family)
LTDRGRNLARDSPTSAGRASVVEEGQIELVNALGVGDRADLDDLPATDREAEYHKEPSTRSHDDSHRSVDERRSCGPGTPLGHPLDHGWRTTDPPRYARRRGTAVCSEHYLRVEHRNKRVEVSGARGSKEGVDLTRNLVRAASSQTRPPHLVYISVVGADDLPMVSRVDRAMFGYFESKREAERVVADSGLPWTTLRATQFHDLILTVARLLSRSPVVPVPAGFRFQPVEADEVAARLVELTLGEPAGLVPDMGGPRVYGMAELLRGYLRATKRRRRLIVPLWLPGEAAHAFRAGVNLAPEQAVGRQTWEEFLAERLVEGHRLTPRVPERTRATGAPSGRRLGRPGSRPPRASLRALTVKEMEDDT